MTRFRDNHGSPRTGASRNGGGSGDGWDVPAAGSRSAAKGLIGSKSVAHSRYATVDTFGGIYINSWPIPTPLESTCPFERSVSRPAIASARGRSRNRTGDRSRTVEQPRRRIPAERLTRDRQHAEDQQSDEVAGDESEPTGNTAVTCLCWRWNEW
ncbi:hypothetical protein NJ7G_0970 [Natrinema sp. J7-2]|nr:hypothetical protein NJ7G_0970 [Natrinema sp. J7-2]